MPKQPIEEGFTFNEVVNAPQNATDNNANAAYARRWTEFPGAPQGRSAPSTPQPGPTQSAKGSTPSANKKQAQSQPLPVTSTPSMSAQPIKQKKIAEPSNTTSSKPATSPATATTTQATTAAPSSVITDPAEAAAAAFNQPLQYSLPNQYAISSTQQIPLPQIVNGTRGSLYVGDLDEEVTEGQLYEVFSTYGVIVNIRVCKDVRTRRSLGYAYVNFGKSEDASNALSNLNYQLLKNRPMRIMWVDRNPEVRKVGNGNVYIKNLDMGIDTRSLHETFKVFGNILSCKVVCDEFGSKGYGYIHFEDPKDAANAIEKVNGMLINDRKVYVGPHIHRRDRLSKQDEMRQNYTNIYVKNFPDNTDNEGLRSMFEKFGEITSAAISTDNDGKSKGFGFVCFKSHEDANRAVDEMHEALVEGKNLYVKRAQKKAEREQKLKEQYEQYREEKLKKYKNINLYVKNLDDSVTDDRLHQEFSDFGVITSAKVMRDEKTGNSKGFGFVCFSSPEEATKAVTEMNGRILVSKPIYVALAQRKDARRAQLSAQMQRNRLRAQQIPQIPDIYQPPPMLYHPQGFAYQALNGTSYFSSGGLMRPRWMTAPHQQLHSPAPIPGPVYLTPMTAQTASQQRPQRQMHPGQQRVSAGPVGAPQVQQMVPGTVPLTGAAMPTRKSPQIPGFIAGPPEASPIVPLVARNGVGVRPVPSKTQMPPRSAMQHPDGGIPMHMPHINPTTLDSEMLSSMPLEQQKRALGDALFSAVHHLVTPKVEGKVTGMLLELDVKEIISILKDPATLKSKVQEAVRALEEHSRKQQQQQQKKVQQLQGQAKQPQQQAPQQQKQRPSSKTQQQPAISNSASGTMGGLGTTEASA